jgi:hypothetical protein
MKRRCTYDATGKGESREFVILSMLESIVVDPHPDRIRIRNANPDPEGQK